MANTAATVIVNPAYYIANEIWLRRYTFKSNNESFPIIYFFSSKEYQLLGTGMAEFMTLTKGNGETETIILPLHAITAIIHGEPRKSQMGFLKTEA